MCFLPYAYYVIVFCLFLLLLLLFEFEFLVCVFFLFVLFLFLLIFLATMSFAGYFLVLCLLSLLFFSERVASSVWFGHVYLLTAAGIVADQLIM